MFLRNTALSVINEGTPNVAVKIDTSRTDAIRRLTFAHIALVALDANAFHADETSDTADKIDTANDTYTVQVDAGPVQRLTRDQISALVRQFGSEEEGT